MLICLETAAVRQPQEHDPNRGARDCALRPSYCAPSVQCLVSADGESVSLFQYMLLLGVSHCL